MEPLSPTKLLNLWSNEAISIEQLAVHILKFLVRMQRAHEAQNLTVYNLRADVDSLIAHTGMSPKPFQKD